MDIFNDMQLIKRLFFAMRNGIIADNLKENGSPYERIFGLNLPQLSEIAKNTGFNNELALQLRDDSRTRESQLLSSMLINPDDVNEDRAIDWLRAMRTQEAIDVLCLKLIRKLNNPDKIAEMCLAYEDILMKYACLRILWNIYINYPRQSMEIIKSASFSDERLRKIADDLMAEIEFIEPID